MVVGVGALANDCGCIECDCVKENWVNEWAVCKGWLAVPVNAGLQYTLVPRLALEGLSAAVSCVAS